jgi:hypothetical protein
MQADGGQRNINVRLYRGIEMQAEYEHSEF